MSTGKVIGISIGGLIVLLALAFLLPGVGLLHKYLYAEPTGKVEAEVQVQSADFRLSAYHAFYDILVSIAEDEAMYDQQYDILKTLDLESKDYLRTRQNMAALAASIQSQKAEYNARAQQWTRGQFLDNGLPDHLDMTSHEYGHRTGGI